MSNGNFSILIHLGSAVMILLGTDSQRLKEINIGNSLGRMMDSVYLIADTCKNLLEDIIFQVSKAIFRTQDLILHLFQFFRIESLSIRKSLLTDITIRNQVLKGIRNFQIIAENLVILNAKFLNTGTFSLFCLKIRKPAFTISSSHAKFIYFTGVAFF